MRPSLRQIEAFLAVAELGSFTRAAERLGSTQPALSQAVRELETGLSLRLFDRTTRRVELTPAGEAFRNRVAKGLSEIGQAFDEARNLASLKAGHLRLAAPPFLAATVLPGAIAEFRRKHPDIGFDLIDTPTGDIITRVRDGRADLGLGTFPPGEPDLDRRPVLREEMMMFCHVGHPLGRAGLTWRDLARQPVIAMAPESGLRLLTEIGFETAGIALRPVYQVLQITTALALVRAGHGLAVLPGYARAACGPGVAAWPLGEPVISRELVLLTAHDRSLPPAALAFGDHLVRALKATAKG